MATKFLEPGGDATFNAALTTAGGFWGSVAGTPQIVTDFVHETHVKSIQYRHSNNDVVTTPSGTLVDAGSRISMYVYIVAYPSITQPIMLSDNNALWAVEITTTGVLQLFKQGFSVQMGSNGPTLSTGKWYRISIAFTLTSLSVNRFEVFVDGVSAISVTNSTNVGTTVSMLTIGNNQSDSTLDFRSSDHYIDNSSSLTDTGDIWVTAKRPNANGTTNGFTTQIGSGGSGYGTGHSPQVNERALSTTNGWSMVGAGSAVTEEYNIEGVATGDIDITGVTIKDYVGWAYMSSLVGETAQMIVNGVSTAQAITSTNTMYTKVAGSTTYPAGTGADIGITTDTSLTTVSLFECGVMVAYTPFVSKVGSMLTMFQ